MKYLDCIELLNYALEKLYVGKRDQVKVGTLKEILTVVNSINNKLDKESVGYRIAKDNLTSAIALVEQTKGITYITESMKNTLVAAVTKMKYEICSSAFEYYSKTQFEADNDKVIELMRDIVSTHLLGGED